MDGRLVKCSSEHAFLKNELRAQWHQVVRHVARKLNEKWMILLKWECQDFKSEDCISLQLGHFGTVVIGSIISMDHISSFTFCTTFSSFFFF